MAISFFLTVSPLVLALSIAVPKFNPVFHREVEWSTRNHGFLGIDLEPFVSYTEDVVEFPDGFELSEDEEAGGFEGVMEYRKQFLLKRRPEVDQQVSTDDEVKLREWWVGRYVLLREDAQLPYCLVYLVGAVRLNKEAS